MKKIFFLVILSLLLFSAPAFSQVGDLGVTAIAKVFTCKDDVCAVRINFTLRSPFPFTTNYIIEYKLVDGLGREVTTFQTAIFTLQGNEEKTLEEIVMMDRARLETVKKVVAVLKYFSPPIRGGQWGGYGPRYWQGTCPRTF